MQKRRCVYLSLQQMKCFYNDLEKYCIDQDIEVRTLKVNRNTTKCMNNSQLKSSLWKF